MSLDYEISNRMDGKLTSSKSPYLRIIIPRLDDELEQPLSVLVNWNSGYFDNFYFPNVKIELYKDGVYDSVVVESTENNGSYIWVLGDKTDGEYTIKITLIGWVEICDVSDIFIIYGGTLYGYYKFDGINDYVEIPDTLRILGTQFTISITYNLRGVTFPPVATQTMFQGSSYLGMLVTNTNHHLLFNGSLGDNTSVHSTVGIPEGDSEWHTITVVVDTTLVTFNDRVKIFFDKVEVAKYITASTAPILNSIFAIPAPYNFTVITEVGTTNEQDVKNFLIYDVALGDADVEKIHDEDFGDMIVNPTISSNCLAFYTMGDSIPDGNEPYTEHTIDYSIHNNHATPINVESNKNTFFNQQ